MMEVPTCCVDSTEEPVFQTHLLLILLGVIIYKPYQFGIFIATGGFFSSQITINIPSVPNILFLITCIISTAFTKLQVAQKTFCMPVCYLQYAESCMHSSR